MRRVGVLKPADDLEEHTRLAVFLQGLQESGWTDGPKRADRPTLDCGRCRPLSRTRGEIGGARVIFASASASVAALLQTTRTVPIVFVNVIDPSVRVSSRTGAAPRERELPAAPSSDKNSTATC